VPGVAVAVVPAVRPGVADATARVADASGVDVPTAVDVDTEVAVVPGLAVDTEVAVDVDPRPGTAAVLVVEGATCGADTPPATFAGAFPAGRAGFLLIGTSTATSRGTGSLRSEGKVGTGVGSVSSATLPAGTSSGDETVGSASRSLNT